MLSEYQFLTPHELVYRAPASATLTGILYIVLDSITTVIQESSLEVGVNDVNSLAVFQRASARHKPRGRLRFSTERLSSCDLVSYSIFLPSSKIAVALDVFGPAATRKMMPAQNRFSKFSSSTKNP